IIPAGQVRILEQINGAKRSIPVVTGLSRAFAPCAASNEASTIPYDLTFFQAPQGQQGRLA
ncbi:MAG: hypothetical protein SNJ67_14095, partial [Chloracidobacterium sp.]